VDIHTDPAQGERIPFLFLDMAVYDQAGDVLVAVDFDSGDFEAVRGLGPEKAGYPEGKGQDGEEPQRGGVGTEWFQKQTFLLETPRLRLSIDFSCKKQGQTLTKTRILARALKNRQTILPFNLERRKHPGRRADPPESLLVWTFLGVKQTGKKKRAKNRLLDGGRQSASFDSFVLVEILC